MHWTRALEGLRRRREPGVLVTIAAVRGHAPRAAGAKMVIGLDHEWGTVGGGNLEATAVARSRAMLAEGALAPESVHLALNERAPVQHGTQCCGGEVELLLEPLPVLPSVAIFGMGHVGVELARILARQDVDLHLVDSRAAYARPARSEAYDDALARIEWHHAPVPELVLGEVPAGTRVLIMTHDHAEDAALCDTALRCGHLASIGLIGSRAKWRRFEKRLLEEGHSREALERILCPIGIPELTGKEPATIAVSVAAQLLAQIADDRPGARPSGAAGAITSTPATRTSS